MEETHFLGLKSYTSGFSQFTCWHWSHGSNLNIRDAGEGKDEHIDTWEHVSFLLAVDALWVSPSFCP